MVVRVRPPARPSRVFPAPLGSRAEVIEHDSTVLAGNPLGDPTRRRVAVLRPPSGRTDGTPLLVLLPGFTGAGAAEIARTSPFEQNLFQLFDHLQRSGECGEATLVSPDCTTALGGSQYVNTSAMGRYEDYVVDEIVPWAEERYRTRGIGVLGQSSGGFGALHLAFERPGRFGAVGSSAGDLGFEHCYIPDFAKACRVYQSHGGPEAFLSKLLDEPGTLKGGPTHPTGSALITAAEAANYSPLDHEPGAFELPFEWETAEFLPAVWRRWKQFDPVARVATPEGAAALRELRHLEVTGSTDDEWGLDQGARWFAAEARRQGLPVVHREFAGGHFDRGPRFVSLFTGLVAALTK
jgi:pimeloyl-ACP methyl ester carboxylesterase